MAIQLVSRRAWGARAASGPITGIRSTRGVKVHYTGGAVNTALLTDHSKCVVAVRGIQNGHMDGNGWFDVGYSLMVCPHRKVFVGRGINKLPAANGAGLNAGHYAVLGLVGSSGLTEPPDNMLLGILDAIEYLRDEGGAGNEIKGHRDGYATDCPGGPLYRWVKAGCPSPEDDDTPVPPVTIPAWPRRYFEYEPGTRLVEGDDVAQWQRQMHHRGWDIDIDGLYGPGSATVCGDFQEEKGLWEDKIVGDKTWRAAFAAPIT